MKYFITILGMLFLMCDTPIPNKQNNQVRRIDFVSQSLKEQSYFLVYVPQSTDTPVAVLYLLNGYGADPYAWASGADLQKAADQYKMIIVSLTAWYNFYVDYENDSTQQNKKYESYVLEIIQIVDDNYDTGKSRAYRGISGISNGGKGAIYISSKHPDMFISASSLSGGFYPGFPPNYENLRNINLLIDVGEDDMSVLSNNRTLHQNLLNNNIQHTYREAPGGHDWRYWGAHYEDHFRFHSKSIKQ
jgi:S-formylglutathione hydrolase FrmB